MSLEILNITFEDRDQFLDDIKGALFEGRKLKKSNYDHELLFDSLETFKKFMGQNKLQILVAISRQCPESIYQLEKILKRKYPHVLNDCRQLESLGFIKLIEATGAKKQLQPQLSFNYDLIKVNSELEQIFPISSKSHDVLLEAKVS
jgi:predicted transcriptional regulator